MYDQNQSKDDEQRKAERLISTEKMMKKLAYLKRTLRPEEKLNIIDQCEIVADALAWGAAYDEDKAGLAAFLDISPNKVYKMQYTHHHAVPELKTYLRGTEYQAHTAYKFAVMDPESQRVFLDAEKTLERGVDAMDYDSSLQSKITEEQ